MQHATADRRTAARAIYLPATPYHTPACRSVLSKARVHLRVVRSRRKNRKDKTPQNQQNVRLTVQPRTRTEKCWFLLCGQPPARPVIVRCSSLPFGTPGSGSRTARRDNPGPVSWECRNTACARKNRGREHEIGEKGGAERSMRAPQPLLFAHAPAPGRRVRAFFSLLLLSSSNVFVCLPDPGLPCLSIRSRDCTNATRDNEPRCVNNPVSRADLGRWVRGCGLRVTCRVQLVSVGFVRRDRIPFHAVCSHGANACHCLDMSRGDGSLRRGSGVAQRAFPWMALHAGRSKGCSE
jgi:hypothetical protein